MKTIITIFIAGVLCCSCKATFNGKPTVRAIIHDDILFLNGKPYTGTKDSFLLAFDQHLVIEQSDDPNELTLAALKQKRKIAVFGKNSFKEFEDVSVFRKQSVGLDSSKWRLVLHSEDEELTYSSLPARF